jgi:hypothetical protein
MKYPCSSDPIPDIYFVEAFFFLFHSYPVIPAADPACVTPTFIIGNRDFPLLSQRTEAQREIPAHPLNGIDQSR